MEQGHKAGKPMWAESHWDKSQVGKNPGSTSPWVHFTTRECPGDFHALRGAALIQDS